MGGEEEVKKEVKLEPEEAGGEEIEDEDETSGMLVEGKGGEAEVGPEGSEDEEEDEIVFQGRLNRRKGVCSDLLGWASEATLEVEVGGGLRRRRNATWR